MTRLGVKDDARPNWRTVPCKMWKGKVQIGRNDPYGWKGRELAHRWAWSQVYGDIPLGMVIAHYCDVRLCVEPLHLWLGTQRENLADMDAKGRRVNNQPGKGHKKPPGHGEKQRIAQFTSRMRECTCGLKTNAGAMGSHIKTRGGSHAVIR